MRLLVFSIKIRLFFISFVKPTIFWTLSSVLVYYVLCVCLMSSEQVLYALMYEVKWISKNPPSTTAIVSNRKDRPYPFVPSQSRFRLYRECMLYRLYQMYRVYRLYRLYRAHRMYRLRKLGTKTHFAKLTQTYSTSAISAVPLSPKQC